MSVKVTYIDKGDKAALIAQVEGDNSNIQIAAWDKNDTSGEVIVHVVDGKVVDVQDTREKK